MTNGPIHILTEPKRRWLNILQLLFFIFTIILLMSLNYVCTSIEIKRPSILLAASFFILFNPARSSELSVVAKIIILYIISMFFNQLSERVVHIRSLSINLSLIVLMPLAISFLCSKSRGLQIMPVDTNNLLKSWGIIFITIILHMLFLFPLLNKRYGYGYDNDFAVLANMCLYFLVFIFSWEQLKNIRLRRIVAAILGVFFIVIMLKGF